MTHLSDLIIILSFILLTIIFFSSIIIVIILSSKYREDNKKINKYFRNYIVSLVFGTISAALSGLFSDNSPVMRVFSILALISSVMSSYYLFDFSNLLFKLELEAKSNKTTKILILLGIVLILLPWNNFGTLSMYETPYYNIQPYTLAYLISFSLYVELRAIKASNHVLSKIFDPILKVIYQWIHKGLIFNAWYIFGLIVSLITYLLPLDYIELVKLVFTLAVFVSIFFIFIAIRYFYYAVVLPERPLRKIYNSYHPMWENKALDVYEKKEKEEEINKIIRNLRSNLFD